MIIITKAAFDRRGGAEETALVLHAAWLDGRQFTYTIDRRGLFVAGFGGDSPYRLHLAIHHFAFVVHDDVWTLLVRERFGMLRRTWTSMRYLMRFRKRQLLPLDDDEIGTAFGVAPYEELVAFLRDVGYRVDVLRWSDLLRIPEPAITVV